MSEYNTIIKNDSSFTKLTNDDIQNKNITFVDQNYYLSNANKPDIPNAGPMIFAHQIDWSGLTTTVNDLPIVINTSQDVVGYLAGALDLVYNGLHQELGDYSTKLNITYNMLESYVSYFNDFSKIIQTYDMIQTYVVEGDNYSTIKQTYDMIQTYVVEGDNYSTIKQTYDLIQTYVVNENNFSRFTQTAEMFETYVSSYTGDFSYIKQTADYIQTYVASYTGDFSYIKQTADRIESIVQTYSGAWSGIEQTAEQIKASVVNDINESYMLLTADQFNTYVGDKVTGYFADLHMDPESISATVQGYNNSYGKWDLTADKFETTVSSYESYWSQFKQTADAITAVVNGYNNSYAKWNISSDGIDATVLDGYTNSYARWNMTADGFDQTVSDYESYWSQFKQTADAITAVVNGYNESYAKWNIAYNNINMSVEDAVDNYMSSLDISPEHIKENVISDINESYMLLTADQFNTYVGDKVTGYFADLHMDPNAINATVQGYNESYAKWNITYDQISSKVWNDDVSSYISQHADSISSTVVEHLENNDYFDSFVNHQDLVAYATKNDLNSYATVSSLNAYATNSRVDQLSDEISLRVTNKQFTDTLASYTTYGYVSSRIYELNTTLSDLSSDIEYLGGKLTAYVDSIDERFNNLSLGYYTTYSANIIDSYASVDINGYLNTFVDLFVWQDETHNDGEDVINKHIEVKNAIVWAYLPDGLVTSGSPFPVEGINNTNEYKDVRQFTEINKTKAKSNLRLDIQIPNQ